MGDEEVLGCGGETRGSVGCGGEEVGGEEIEMDDGAGTELARSMME